MLCNLSIPFSDNSVVQGLDLQASPQEHRARCGENVTLTCEATSPHPLDIKLFFWWAMGLNKTVCQYKNGQPDPEVLCESDAEAEHYRLTLTLVDLKPDNQGEYFCKLQSNRGAKSTTAVVTVQGKST